MSVADEIDSLKKRAQSVISRRGYRRDWIIVYAEGLRAKIKEAEFALNELSKFVEISGDTVTATSPEGLLPKYEIYFYSDTFWSAPSKAGASKLANPAWPKPNQQARTELCAYGGNEICGAKGTADYRP